MIDTGLVIDTPWIRKILAGAKTWEIRTKPNSKTGRIALCEKGGPIVATAIIGRSISIPSGEFDRHFDKHQVRATDLQAFYGDRPVYAWPLSDVRKIDQPIPYKHPGGGSWVKLELWNVTGLSVKVSLAAPASMSVGPPDPQRDRWPRWQFCSPIPEPRMRPITYVPSCIRGFDSLLRSEALIVSHDPLEWAGCDALKSIVCRRNRQQFGNLAS